MNNGTQLTTYLSSLSKANRIPETLGYNIFYFAIGLGLSHREPFLAFMRNSPLLVALFFAIMLFKTQASIADALHDYEIDKRNPEKSPIADAVDIIGERNLRTMLMAQICISLLLWGWISVSLDSIIYLVLGAVGIILGYTYSYPPRLKERGVYNHIATTGVDVLCAIVPVMLIIGTTFDSTVLLSLAIVFLYTFGYHIMHQAADTYYDRESGINTFTQQIGIRWSVLLTLISTGIAAIIGLYLNYYLAFAGLLIGCIGYSYIYYKITGLPEKSQSDLISNTFSVGFWATTLNGVMALNLLA